MLLTADSIGMEQNNDSAIKVSIGNWEKYIYLGNTNGQILKVDLNKIQNDFKHGFNGSEESIIIELDDLMISQNSTGVEDGNLREMRWK